MDCVIPGHSFRTFGAAISCLSRIGKDIYLEFDAREGLFLRSLNDSKSAYSCFHFKPAFFERCAAKPQQRSRGGRKRSLENNAIISCRIAIRALSAVIRSRKNILSLGLSIPYPNADDSAESSPCWMMDFDLSLHQEHGTSLLRVKHRVPLAEAESLSAICSREGSSVFSITPKVLTRALDPLVASAREAALTIGPDTFTLVGFVEVANGASAGVSRLQTETGLSLQDLELDYPERSDTNEDMPEDINENVTLVFPLKEAKAFVGFASRQVEDVLTVQFHWGGKPMLWEAKAGTFSAELILATLDHKLLDRAANKSTSTTVRN